MKPRHFRTVLLVADPMTGWQVPIGAVMAAENAEQEFVPAPTMAACCLGGVPNGLMVNMVQEQLTEEPTARDISSQIVFGEEFWIPDGTCPRCWVEELLTPAWLKRRGT